MKTILINNLKLIVGIVIGITLSILFKCEKSITPQDKDVIVNLVTKLDTVYLDRLVYIPQIPVRITETKHDTVFIPGTKEVVMIPAIKREYKDSILVDSGLVVNYTANTTGTLDNLKLGLRDTRPLMIVKETTTITKDSKFHGFIGYELSPSLSVASPSVQLQYKKNVFGVNYNLSPTIKEPTSKLTLSYHRQLW